MGGHVTVLVGAHHHPFFIEENKIFGKFLADFFLREKSDQKALYPELSTKLIYSS